MYKNIIFSFLLLTAFDINASKEEITMDLTSRKNRTEVGIEPRVNYDDDSNTVEVTIEADNYFTMVVLDIYGTKVYSCPVLMVDGTPTNYQLPELPAGIYTLKVESEEVSYEGTLVIE